MRPDSESPLWQRCSSVTSPGPPPHVPSARLHTSLPMKQRSITDREEQGWSHTELVVCPVAP